MAAAQDIRGKFSKMVRGRIEMSWMCAQSDGNEA